MASGGRTFTSAAQSPYQLILLKEAKAAGTGAHYNAHLAFCPEPFHKHLKRFNGHLEAVRRELSWKITKAGDLERLALPCFFLRNTPQGLRVDEVTRGDIESRFKEFKFGFPVNVHRRFVSGELLDDMVEIKATENHSEQMKWNGVAPELVDWWMSHWSVGDEPWNKSSSLSLEAYKHELPIRQPDRVAVNRSKGLKSRRKVAKDFQQT
jgi:hypothetical protein